jgi:hypothetical protein
MDRAEYYFRTERDNGCISKDKVALKEIKEKYLCGYMTWKSSSARIRKNSGESAND